MILVQRLHVLLALFSDAVRPRSQERQLTLVHWLHALLALFLHAMRSCRQEGQVSLVHRFFLNHLIMFAAVHSGSAI